MSDDLIQQYRDIHSREKYGNTSVKNLPYLLPHIDDLNPSSIVDFGCGLSILVDDLSSACGAQGVRYDPAIPAYSAKPAGRFNLLLNIDVLEHVPETALDDLIGEMAGMADNAIIVIDTGPAVLILPDGRNAHISQFPQDWWARKLARHFSYLEPIRVRSTRRAAFKTWRTSPNRTFTDLRIFIGAEANYRWRKLFGTGAGSTRTA